MSSIVWPLHIQPKQACFLFAPPQLQSTIVLWFEALSKLTFHAWLTLLTIELPISEASDESLNFVFIKVTFNTFYECATIIF